jgi:hypothetical protein
LSGRRGLKLWSIGAGASDSTATTSSLQWLAGALWQVWAAAPECYLPAAVTDIALGGYLWAMRLYQRDPIR